MEKLKWYFSPAAIVIAILLFGPIAIPLVWKHPTLSKRTKYLTIILIVVLTVWMCMTTVGMLQQVLKRLQELKKTLEM